MKFPFKFPVHIQILTALVLGAIFGVIFSVDHHKLILESVENGVVHESTSQDWKSITFTHIEDTTEIIKTFGPNDQIQIVNYFNSLSKEARKSLAIVSRNSDGEILYSINDVRSIKKETTPATMIKPIGTLFIRLLSFLAIPLVIATLIVGAASLDDIRKLGRIGGKTFALYLMTTALAITIGLAAANIIKPGDMVSEDARNRLMGAYQSGSEGEMVDQLDINVLEFIVNIVPKNPINAMANGKMLQIVFFAVLFGMTLTFIEKRKAGILIDFFGGISEVMIKMVDLIMKIAPYGVFALIAATIADFGFDIISTLIWYILAVIIGLLLQTAGVYSILVRFLGRTSLVKFFKGMRNAQAIGFSTSSSAATLPVTFECVEKNIGVPKQISGFVLPLGATINMDGTALYQGVAAVFIAQVYGFDLSLIAQLTIVFTAVLASIGTAPVPGVGIIMLVIILQAINVPPEGIALILGVDRILDMCRTVTNITGDAAVSVAVAGTEKARNERREKYKLKG